MGATAAVVLFIGCTLAAESLKSGPQVGDFCVPFEPLNVNGPFSGDRQCLV
jgi:hypothetical protein